MSFLMNKSQNQKVSETIVSGTTEFGKNKYELEQYILRNLNNSLDINNESSYLG
jgi:hypothetical protein